MVDGALSSVRSRQRRWELIHNMARRYDPNASKEVEKTMHEHEHEGKFKNRQQAVAVGLSKARRKGKQVPEKEE